jgi:hypothetical protein
MKGYIKRKIKGQLKIKVINRYKLYMIVKQINFDSNLYFLDFE